MIKKIKNLFKIYDLLVGDAIIIDPKNLNISEEWIMVNVFFKKVGDKYAMNDLALFEYKTKDLKKFKNLLSTLYYRFLGGEE